MYRTILIALDGSRNAEKVLPYVEPLLLSGGGRAMLVQVLQAARAPVLVARHTPS
jgi:nucleotide-binding universal stress UspA family protein